MNKPDRSSLLSPLSLLLTLLCCLCSGAIGQTLTGTVTNKTNNKPAAGDDVVLIRLAQGMQESVRTKTDAKGRYSLELPDPGLHLVRVTHDKANYFHPAPPGTSVVDVEVYNAAAKVKGVVGEADVMRLQTDEPGKILRVVENFFVRNDSSPPMTQFSDRPFEFYLPKDAVVEGSAALAPGGMPVQASPVPLGDPGHYAFIFPIRPGETRFQVSYHLPYSGSMQLSPKPQTVTDTVAVMMPKGMTFKAAPGAPYSAIQDEVNAQTFVARNVSPSQPLGFTVGGAGQMPRDTASPTADAAAAGAAGAPTAAAGGASASGDTRPGGGLGNPVDPGATNDPWAKYRWWIIGGLGLVLAAGAGVMLKRSGDSANGVTAATAAPQPIGSGAMGVSYDPASAGQHGILAALKEELFALETERLRGRISEAEYAEHKTALERVLRRVLVRTEPSSQPSSSSLPTGALAPDLVARSGIDA